MNAETITFPLYLRTHFLNFKLLMMCVLKFNFLQGLKKIPTISCAGLKCGKIAALVEATRVYFLTFQFCLKFSIG